MSRELASIDPNVLDNVTGGTSSGSGSSGGGGSAGSNIDNLLGQLNSITSSIKDIKTKTNGLSSSEMFMLCALAMQNRPASASVIYVGPRRGRW